MAPPSLAAGATPALPREEIDALFEILAESGAGGMGTVFEARERATGRKVALKIVTSGQGNYERFALEADILSRLDHPGIVAHVAYGEGARGPWLAMEWLDGETLGDALARGAFDVKTTLTLGITVTHALAAAHACKIVHRDLKPSNLFLVGGDPAATKILDFGVARLREDHRELTLTNQIVGTPGYMAPEQARGLRDVDARADLFSLGCVLFRALTGKPPFDGPDVLSVLAKLAGQDPPPVGELVDDVPEPLERLIVTLLAKAPGDRPESAEAVREELVRIAAIVDVAPAIQRPRRARGTSHLIECVVLARRPLPEAAEGAPPAPAPELSEADVAALRDQLAAAGGRLRILGGGAILVHVDEQPSSGARAEAAARCAGILSRASWQVSIASGHTERIPVGGDTAEIPAESGPRATSSGAVVSGESAAIDRASLTLADARAGAVRVAASADSASAVERAFHRELLRAIRDLGTPLELAPTVFAPAPTIPVSTGIAPAPRSKRVGRVSAAALAIGGLLAGGLIIGGVWLFSDAPTTPTTSTSSPPRARSEAERSEDALGGDRRRASDDEGGHPHATASATTSATTTASASTTAAAIAHRPSIPAPRPSVTAAPAQPTARPTVGPARDQWD